jgi:sugar phosphate isomerase/epimerase
MSADLAVQLYSLREECEADLAGVLGRLGEIGYTGVEFAGFHGHAPADVAAMLDAHGLKAASAHVAPGPDLDVNTVATELEAIGCDTAVVPVLGVSDPSDPVEVAAACAQVNDLAAALRDSGVSVGYHNHWWEFETAADGISLFERFREQFSPEVFFEVDVYWAAVGGADVAALLSELGDRARLLHVKDGPADEPGSAMTAVGHGTLDIPVILNAASGPDWLIVELDRCATDMLTAVDESYRYLAGLR